jgi:glycine/D-amino acid oxidase-like deaminating enzyme
MYVFFCFLSISYNRLVHPLSPRGKLVYLGLECLQATQELVQEAQWSSSISSRVRLSQTPNTDDKPHNNDGNIVLRQEILRLALTETHVQQLKATSETLPQYCTWLNQEELPDTISRNKVMGALKIHQGGCLVVHVPSYLQGLWKACENLAKENNVQIEYKLIPTSQNIVDAVPWSDLDAVVLAAGAGLLQEQGLLCDNDSSNGNDYSLPVQLVRGQSVELRANQPLPNALLCGKYVSPLPGCSTTNNNRVLVGATHEFTNDPLPIPDVTTFLQDATTSFYDWSTNGVVVDRVTEGYRVQSQRGPQGRRPIMGRLSCPGSLDKDRQISGFAHHDRAYIYTGLSSRGLLYHAYYARALVQRIFRDTEQNKEDSLSSSSFETLLTDDDWNWWRREQPG